MKIFYIIALCLTNQICLCQINVISLKEAIYRAISNNIQIKQAEHSLNTAQLNYKQSKLNQFPSLNSSISHRVGFGLTQNQVTFQLLNTQNNNTSVGITTNLNLYSGGTILQQIRQNKLLLNAENISIAKIKNDITLQVISSYLEVLIDKELLKAADKQREFSKKNLTQITEFYQAGIKTDLDVANAIAELHNYEANYINYDGEYKKAKLILGQLMELNNDSNFDVQEIVLDNPYTIQNKYSLNEIINVVKMRYPEIALTKIQTEIAKKGVLIAKGGFYPKISLNAGLNNFTTFISGFTSSSVIRQLKNNFGQYIGISITAPIFNSTQTKINTQKAQINLLDKKLNETLANNLLHKILQQALLDLNIAIGKYDASKEVLKAQEESLRVSLEKYKIGAINYLELVTIENNRNKAENENIQAKYNLIFRNEIIDYYLGKSDL